MSNTNTGGPAFPQAYEHTAVVTKMYGAGELTAGQLKNATSQLAGMTLRDYFAAKAMQGLMAVPDDQRYGDRADKSLTVDQWQRWCVTGLVEHAYRVADAMLKAREQ
jgi:glycerol kinase